MILFVSSVYAQTEKSVTIPTYKNYKNEIDTSLWFKWKHDLAKQINLKDLQTSTDTFHFRFWTDVQAIDIWNIDHNLYFGTVTNYAQRYDDKLLRKGIYKIGKVYSNQVTLDSSKARLLFNTIDKLSIVAIPTDDKINGWRQGFDGEEFLIETSTPTHYDFKTYWTPRIFADTLKEAKQIQTLVDYFYTDLKIYNYYQKLKLPEGSYQRNGIQGIEIKTPNQYIPGTTKVTDLL
jgi:hypothetical protein